MAHMTKKHKELLLEQYLAEQEAMERAEYFPKLVQTLDAARALGYNLTVENKEFRLREHAWTPPIRLGTEYSRENLGKLEEFERELQATRETRAEKVRRAKVHQAALAKLTAEEREILGLR